MTPRPSARRSVGGSRGTAFGLVEVFTRDALVNTTAVVSFVVVIAGVVRWESAWGVGAVVVGLAGLPLPWLSLSHQRPTPILWMVVRCVLLLDLALLVAMLYTS